MLSQREEQLKELEREYNLKKLESNEVQADLQNENAKCARCKAQVEELKSRQKMLTGEDYVSV